MKKSKLEPLVKSHFAPHEVMFYTGYEHDVESDMFEVGSATFSWHIKFHVASLEPISIAITYAVCKSGFKEFITACNAVQTLMTLLKENDK